jgi:DNA polymerase sigma
MVIQYLQVVEPPVLPSLQEIIKKIDVDKNDISSPHYLYGYDTGYFSNLKKLPNYFKSKNAMEIGELTKGFFHFYAKEFEFEKSTISIRLGKPVPKKWEPLISIEDPFEIRDLGVVLMKETEHTIINEFERAYSILENVDAKLSDVIMISDKEEKVNRYESIKQNYNEYLSNEDIEAGLKDKTLFKGSLRVNKKKYIESII